MTDIDPYEPGAIWYHQFTGSHVVIVLVFEDPEGLAGLAGASYVVTKGTGRLQIREVGDFVREFKRPDGTAPQPVNIPRQRTEEP